ncbi:MAG TPA: hypothetical protein VKY59_02420 [Spirillospora sp.]|nr:hypothetical protein [Spirillospora sp.]
MDERTMGPGYHVLVVMDYDPAACLGLVDALIDNSSDLSNRYITLMCCCPPAYWEHGGRTATTETAGAEHELRRADVRYQRNIETANQMFAAATGLLQDAGVPKENIKTHICFESENLTEAVIRALRTHGYSTVVIDRRHHEVVNRLTRRGIWKLLARHVPPVTVWAIDVQDRQAEVIS